MRIRRWIIVGAALVGSCSAVPTRSIDCTNFGQCEPLQFVFGQPNEFTNNRLRTGLSGPNSALVVNGRLFVADTGQHRVLIWNTYPPPANQLPDIVLGQPDLTTAQANYDGLSARSLAGPASIASDGTRLAVADALNYRILIWNSIPTAHFAPADVVLGQRDFTTTVSPTTPSNQTVSGSPIATPSIFAGVRLVPSPKTSGQSMLIATDAGANRVLFWDPVPVTGFAAATGALGQADYVSGSAAVGAGRFSAPAGSPSLDASQVAVADSQNHRVVVFSAPPILGASTTAGSVFLGQKDGSSGMANQGTAAATRSSLSLPLGVSAVGKKLYVADSNNNRVMIWNDDTVGTGVDADVVLGQTRFDTGVLGAVSASSLYGPRSVWSDNASTVVADTNFNRVLIWTNPITTIGQAADRVIGQPSFGMNQISTSPSLSATEMSAPYGLCADGVFLIADTQANRVLYWPHVPLGNTDGPTLVLGQTDFTSSQPLQNGISGSSLWLPSSVSCQNGVVAVSDHLNHRVLLWTRPIVSMAQAADLILGQPGPTTNDANRGGTALGLSSPFAVHLRNGKIYVADTGNHRVLIWNQIPSAGQTQKAPDLVLGQSDMMRVQPNSGLMAPTASTVNGPMGVYHDGTRLYVSDSGNHRVLLFPEPITTAGQPAQLVIGQPDLTTATTSTVRGDTLGTPFGVAVDGERLYIADANNNRVVYFQHIPTQNGQIADGVIGQPDLMSRQANQGGLRGNRLQQPTAVLPTHDALYIADTANGRVVVLPPPQ